MAKITCTDAMACQAFYDEMNEKARAMGLKDTDFVCADGWVYDANYTTSDEYVRVIAKAMNYTWLAEAFGTPYKTIHVKGSQPRDLELKSTVVIGKTGQAAVLYDDYWLLGGKTGTLNVPKSSHCLGINLEHKRTGARITVVGFGVTPDEDSWNRFTRVKALADIAMLIYEAGERNIRNSDDIKDPVCKAKVKEIEAVLHPGAVSGTVVLTPQGNAYDNSNYSGEDNSRHLYSYNGSKKVLQASLAKVMTCMVLSDWITDWHETFTLIPEEIKNGCSAVTYAGDNITFADSLYLMMLPSSNDVACAVARVVGHKIYEVKNR